jgi:hypothetical protein
MSGWRYKYTIFAQILRNGKVMTDTQEVILRGGEALSVNFDFPDVVAKRLGDER